MIRVARYLPYAALGLLLGCGGKAPPPAEPPAGPQPSAADLSAAITAAAGTDVGDARYFDASVDLDGDGTAEKLVYLAGPMMCGTGGCPLYVFTPGADGYRLVSRLSVVQLPVRLSPRSSQGWRNLVVHVAGGGMPAADVELEFDGTSYPANPTVEPTSTVTDLSGTEVLIDQFDSYTEGNELVTADTAPASASGDGSPASVAILLGEPIQAQDADELRYLVLKALTDRYAAEKGITVTQAEKEAYVKHVREALSKDPAVAATLGEESDEDKAARLEIADAFIRQWKINRALYEQYGGRIGYQQGGPEPLDAYRKFLEERQAAGDFKITNGKLAAQFWIYFLDDSIHSFYEPGSKEEAAAFATPPWQSS